MTVREIKQILLDELENKKSYDAKWETVCDSCGDDIQEEDSFIFMGDKQKICNECQGHVTEFLEEQ